MVPTKNDTPCRLVAQSGSADEIDRVRLTKTTGADIRLDAVSADTAGGGARPALRNRTAQNWHLERPERLESVPSERPTQAGTKE